MPSDSNQRSQQRIRTCIARRRPLPEASLLRVVALKDPDESTAVRAIPDPQRKMGGRGAWISPTLEALELAEKRRAFNRALRVSAVVDTGHVREYLAGLTARPNIVRKTEH